MTGMPLFVPVTTPLRTSQVPGDSQHWHLPYGIGGVL